MKPLSSALCVALAAGILGLALTAPAASPASPVQERDPGRAFEALKRRLDKNLDGKISKEEFNRGQRAFKRLDADGDGFLTQADADALAGKGKVASDQPRPELPSEGTAPQATAEQIEFFETNVRPVLVEKCFKCHSTDSKRIKAGLTLNTREGFLTGGESGPAMVPGDVEASSFIEAIRYQNPDFEMPPKERLSDQQIADLESWVRMGAPWPSEPDMGSMEMSAAGSTDDAPHKESLNRHIDIDAGRQFWSFQPPVRSEPPNPEHEGWARSAIDRFLLANMETTGVAPVDDADDRTWLRRVTFDLTGLPPTPEDIAAFLDDSSKERDAHVVDRLLASNAYAERWGRHWLDVARYAESSGKEQNVVYPHAWRYRDWVLAAFRADMPYDRFLKLQLAGDLVPVSDETEHAWNQIATGYLAIGSKGHANRDRTRFQLDMVDEQIDAMSQGMLGLTVSCARCHDHKFDPIPTKDYYALAGIFLSTDTHFGTLRGPGNNQPSDLLALPQAADLPNGPDMGPEVRRLLERGRERLDKASQETMEMEAKGDKADAAQTAFQKRTQADQERLLADLLARFDDRGRALPKNRLAMGVSEGEPRDIAVLERGELDRPGEVVPRNMPQVLRSPDAPPIRAGSGRLELATWIASADNPLTARVWANRVWLHLFGSGIVPTPDNFGAAGLPPTHPELLDWLATELVAQGWSTKALIREITLSHAYRLSSRSDRAAEAIDPDVRTLWRMPKRRLESEALRDAMLAVAGTLSDAAPVGSAAGTFEGVLRNEQVAQIMLREQPVRSVYLPAPRGFVMDTLAAFDAPDSEFVTGDRDETTVATQALFLMNDSEVLRLADAFAGRLLDIPGSDDDKIRAGFELALGRQPTNGERHAVSAFLRDYQREVERTIEQDASQGKAKDAAPSSDRQRQRDQARARAREKARELARQRNGAPGNAAPEPLRDPRRAAWSAFAQSLFQGAEFRVIG
ncbi:MAG: DUF1549 domain-containing protein [Planctomycetes bacterium]|nr:DUF1549 domain-containing protein [Planctomycetota bacterium]MCB9909814.1 DUF1549 domain-containing protein [Planctomycetota bacterium]MCB9912277.1 DUF1549 domain-containing protein [Planctomycetota bacterium]